MMTLTMFKLKYYLKVMRYLMLTVQAMKVKRDLINLSKMMIKAMIDLFKNAQEVLVD